MIGSGLELQRDYWQFLKREKELQMVPTEDAFVGEDLRPLRAKALIREHELVKRLLGWEEELRTNKDGFAYAAPGAISELRKLVSGYGLLSEYELAKLRYYGHS